MSLLDDGHQAENDHQYGDNDLYKHVKGYGEVKSQGIEDVVGVRLYQFTQQEDTSQDSKPINPNSSWQFCLECQDN